MSNHQLNSETNNRNLWIKVDCKDLVLGMFIVGLDRPWKDTPFPINGFHLRKFDQIQNLRILCNYVYIDHMRGAKSKKKKQNLTILSSARERSPASLNFIVNNGVYPRTRAVKQEIDRASHLYGELSRKLDEAITSARDHKQLGIAEIYKLSAATIDCVIGNPDAFIWYLNTSEQDSCILKHSHRAAIWATVFACHIGLSRDNLEALFVGTLMSDIGMAKFPSQFITKTGPFTRKEYLVYRKHVGISVDIVGAEENIDPRVLDVIRGHHERHDGLGFPRRHSGDQIPVLARIANLAYSYERLLKKSSTSDLSPAIAIGRLYKQRKLKFAEQVVFEFIKALGMFPAGSVVELENGSIGIVTEQNHNLRLAPKIAVITTSRKIVLKKFQLINQSAKKEGSATTSITRSLKKGSYNIDPAELTSQIFGKRFGFGRLGLRI